MKCDVCDKEALPEVYWDVPIFGITRGEYCEEHHQEMLDRLHEKNCRQGEG